MLKKFLQILMFALLTLTQVHSEDEVVKKIVYNLTTGDLDRFQSRLIKGIVSHATYYESKLQDLEVKVIIHGDAYKFFMSDLKNTPYATQKALVKAQPDLHKRLKSLTTHYNVTFLVCEAGVKNRNLNPKAFYPFAKMVHNAAIGLIDAQHEGYGYMPLH
ncbi:MAG: DsrE family protein [Epsilonproteobacteria bacterium]|nr:DsrE family protein [Campylobacterota bacterium]